LRIGPGLVRMRAERGLATFKGSFDAIRKGVIAKVGDAEELFGSSGGVVSEDGKSQPLSEPRRHEVSRR